MPRASIEGSLRAERDENDWVSSGREFTGGKLQEFHHLLPVEAALGGNACCADRAIGQALQLADGLWQNYAKHHTNFLPE